MWFSNKKYSLSCPPSPAMMVSSNTCCIFLWRKRIQNLKEAEGKRFSYNNNKKKKSENDPIVLLFLATSQRVNKKSTRGHFFPIFLLSTDFFVLIYNLITKQRVYVRLGSSNRLFVQTLSIYCCFCFCWAIWQSNSNFFTWFVFLLFCFVRVATTLYRYFISFETWYFLFNFFWKVISFSFSPTPFPILPKGRCFESFVPTQRKKKRFKRYVFFCFRGFFFFLSNSPDTKFFVAFLRSTCPNNFSFSLKE